MRVLHVQKANGIAGAERHLLSLLPGLVARDVEVRVLVGVSGNGAAYADSLVDAGIDVVTVPTERDVDPRFLSAIRREIRARRPDLVHTHLIHADVHGQVAARASGVPGVQSIHGVHDFYRTQPYRSAATLAGKLAARTIAISEHAARFGTDVGFLPAPRVRVVRYGVDVSRWERDAAAVRAERGRLGIADGEVVVGIASRLIPDKGHDLLIEAVAKARVGHPDIRLLVAGDGPLRRDLEQQANERLGDAATFLGFAPDMPGFMSACDIVAFTTQPALGEGFGLAALEASAAGRPVIASDIASLPEIVEHRRTGLLVEPGSVEALSNAIELLAADPHFARRLGAAGRERARRHFSVETMVDHTLDVYREVLDRPKAVFVGRSPIAEPVPDDLRRHYAIKSSVLDATQIAPGHTGVRHVSNTRIVGFPAFRPKPLASALFYAAAPPLAVVMASGARPSAVVCQSPFEGLGAVLTSRLIPHARRPAIQVELHGDWRTAPRLYGHPVRRTLAPLTDRIAGWTVRRADRVRPVSEVLERQALDVGYRGPLDRFIEYSEFGIFLDDPATEVPASAEVLFAGVLERYKAVDVLLDAWPQVVEEVPDARLTVVGTGRRSEELHDRVEREQIPCVRFRDPVPRPDLVRMMDDAAVIVLPSRSEGLPRIVMEGMARGRPIVASKVGGMEELIDDHRSGRLVPAEDTEALRDALADVLRAPLEKRREMGRIARSRAEQRNPAAEFEAGIRRLAEFIREWRP